MSIPNRTTTTTPHNDSTDASGSNGDALTNSVENYIQAVVDAGHPVPQSVKIKSILDVAALHLAEHLVPLEPTEPLDPRFLPIIRGRGVGHLSD